MGQGARDVHVPGWGVGRRATMPRGAGQVVQQGVWLPKGAAYFGIHGNFMGVKIKVKEEVHAKTHRIWTWGGAPSSNPMSFRVYLF